METPQITTEMMIRMPVELKIKMLRIKEETGVPMAYVVKKALEEYLQNHYPDI